MLCYVVLRFYIPNTTLIMTEFDLNEDNLILYKVA